MNQIVGHCPKCGAPIYAPMNWQSITPPPSIYSCACNGSALAQRFYVATGTGKTK